MIVFDKTRTLQSQLPNDKCVVLIDEADMIILDHAQPIANRYVFGFSATLLTGQDKVEEGFVKALNFDCMDSCI